MKATLAELLRQIPGAPSAEWPDGERYAVAFEHGSMTLGFYAPRGLDPQTPHERDEVYIIHAGRAQIVIGAERHECQAGDAFFVGAGVVHRFENQSSDFSAWVVFWGPVGGEQPH